MERLINSLKRCAEAHNAKYEHFADEMQFGIYKLNVPLLADINNIVHGFTGDNLPVCPEHSFGIITIYLDECEILPDEQIDWELINISLPTER